MSQYFNYYDKYVYVLNKACHATFCEIAQKSVLAVRPSKRRFKICSTSPEIKAIPLELFIQRMAFYVYLNPKTHVKKTSDMP